MAWKKPKDNDRNGTLEREFKIRGGPLKESGGPIKYLLGGRELGPEKIIPLSEFLGTEVRVDNGCESWKLTYGPLPRIPVGTQEMDATYNFKPHRWGLREFHPLSFGVGFLLSTLFWLTIGIVLRVISG